MSFKPNLAEQELMANTFELEGAGMTRRDWIGESLVSAGLLAGVVGVWLAEPPRAVDVPQVILYVALIALATLVRFDTPFGFTVATQLAFVPALFALPLPLVLPVVVAGLAIARVPEVLSGRLRPSRLLLVIGNSWFALGAVAVFALSHTPPAIAGPMLLLAALAAQFTGDFLVSGFRNWMARDASLSAQLGDSWVYVIDAALSGIALVVAEDVHTTRWSVLSVIPLLGVLAMFAHERHDRLASLLELGNAYRGTALVLGDVVEADDGYTSEHCKGVVGLSLAVGQRMGLRAEQLRNVEFGALLHDVGKIAIPKAIINKPGPLDPTEWLIIKTHTIQGQKMLDRVGGFMREVGLIVRSHHERWDGQGYPDGLAGDAIPLEARIIACCDTWNAMCTDRVYRKALSYEAALQELMSGAGGQFDPAVVEAALEIIEPQQAIFPEPPQIRLGAGGVEPAVEDAKPAVA